MVFAKVLLLLVFGTCQKEEPEDEKSAVSVSRTVVVYMAADNDKNFGEIVYCMYRK